MCATTRKASVRRVRHPHPCEEDAHAPMGSKSPAFKGRASPLTRDLCNNRVYSDEHASYEGMPFEHDSVKHSVGEYVRGMVHTNGVESFWSTLKRAHKGTFHKLSPKHLDRYVQEFAGKHNIRDADTLEQMTIVAAGLIGRRLMYRQLIAPNGRDSGARPPADG